MKKTVLGLGLAAGLALTTAGHADLVNETNAPANPPATVIVHPGEDSNAILHNPDMGWVFYEFGKQMSGGYTYPDVDYVAIAAHWNGIERSEGQYNFSGVDKLYDYWAGKGKKIMLRLMVEDVGTSAPAYIIGRLTQAEIQERRMAGYQVGPYREIDGGNAFYQTRLTAFLSALAEHYAPAGPRPVVTVDLRGFGLWGEWHSGFVFRGMPAPGTQNPAAMDLHTRTNVLRQLIDIWSAAMPKIQLLLSYSHDPDSPASYWNDPRHFGDYLRYSAFDYATNKANISWRRDGCYGALKGNERAFNEVLFRLGKGPLFSEFAGGYQSDHAAAAVKDALSLHPNYICLYGYSGHKFHDQHRDVFDDGLRAMGYRFVPVSVQYPARVSAGSSFTINFAWINRGVGRALSDYELMLKWKDAADNDVASADLGQLNCSQWVKGELYPVTKSVQLPVLPTGEYQLGFALRDPRSGQPIALPLREKVSDGSYPLGRQTVSASRINR